MKAAWLSALALSPFVCLAQGATGTAPGPGTGIDYALTLDGAWVSSDLALPGREQGLALGHTEATLGGNINELFSGRVTAAAHEEEGSIEFELEEAFVETRTLPAGLSLRAGRFFSQIGYLNEQHSHADDFVERPLLYRAFLGGHYFDSGLRLNWTAPTDLYWRIGAEVFDGGRLLPDASHRRTVGAWALATKFGGDLGIEHSWQAGVAYLRNQLDLSGEPAHGHAGHAPDLHQGHHGLDPHDGHGGHDGEHEAEGHGSHPRESDAEGDAHAHEHGHTHGARYAGRNLWLADFVWKWAPNGNNRERQLRLSAEYARVTGLGGIADGGDLHDAWYLSAVYRFAPEWEAGVRHAALRVSELHGDHFHEARLRETNLMLAWKRSHASTLRLQWTTQRERGGFAEAGDALMLQYVMNLGEHRAHSF